MTPENVYDATIKVRPAGVDTHTGVEDDSGRKNKSKVIKFIEEVKQKIHKLAPLRFTVLDIHEYYASVEKGLNPDRPRNLAKSVTVI